MSQRSLVRQLRDELQPRHLLPGIVAGLLAGVTMVLWSVTIAALIFGGDLAPYVAQATGYFLFGSLALALIMGLTSSYAGTIAASDEAAAIILSLCASAIALNIGSGGLDSDLAFLTVMVLIIASTLLSGLVFLILGKFKLGNLVRYIPYPVIGGVVVTMGWLIILGGFGVMMDVDITSDSFHLLLEPEHLINWIPGTIFAVTLLVTMRGLNHYLVLPVVFIAAIALYYLIVILSGMSVSELEVAGLLVGPFPEHSPWSTLNLSEIGRIDWSLLLAQIPDVASLILLCVLGLLLSATGIEFALKKDMDLNRELESAGYANIIAAMGGGVTGSHSVEDSLLAHEMGAPYRLVSVVTALVCGAALVFGIEVLSYLPRSLLGGFILFFGLLLLLEWLYESWFTLPKIDYFVIVLCLLVSASAGYLLGITVGIIAGMAIFIINYSRVDIVKHALSGANYHSNVEREASSRQLLDQYGDQIQILKLQGYIFFGTGHNLLMQVRNRAEADELPPLAYVVLNFNGVSNIDISAVNSFYKMHQLADQFDFTIVVASVSTEVRKRILESGMNDEKNFRVKEFRDSDQALEWCEDQLLKSVLSGRTERERSLFERLCDQFPEPGAAADFMTYLDLRSVKRAEYLIRQGDDSTDLFFVESGRVAIQLESPNQDPIRLRSMGAGTVVGEVALYLKTVRSASVIAEQDSVVYRLTKEMLHAMKQENPGLAASFHEFIVRLLARRLVNNNKLIHALMD